MNEVQKNQSRQSATLHLLKSQFEKDVRVKLAWNALAEEDWMLQHETFTEIDVLSKWYLPWYFNHEGKPTCWSDPTARPIRLARVLNLFPTFEMRRQQSITDFAKTFVDGLRPAHQEPFRFLTYVVEDGDTLLLDGCHRAAALMIARVPFHISQFIIQGPAEERILPDLRHFKSEAPHGAAVRGRG